MPKNLSKELLERLEQQKADDRPPLQMNYFVSIHWTLDGTEEQDTHKCYSTFHTPVKMDGNLYNGKEILLDFNEEAEQGFVMSSDHLIYGASCGFRVFDSEGIASRIVRTANERQDFPSIHFDAWMHFSGDSSEIESLAYGEKVFSSFVTRLELQKDKLLRPVAKVWGGHAGIVASRTGSNSGKAASVLGRPMRLGARVTRLLSESG